MYIKRSKTPGWTDINKNSGYIIFSLVISVQKYTSKSYEHQTDTKTTKKSTWLFKYTNLFQD